jgi:hypothetical protein
MAKTATHPKNRVVPHVLAAGAAVEEADVIETIAMMEHQVKSHLPFRHGKKQSEL